MLQGSTWGNQFEYWDYFNNQDTSVTLNHRVMFDGSTRTIWILAGIDYLSVKQHLYSDWKEWVALYFNSKWPQAFETEGGRPISATERLGDSYLLINDWVIRQRDSSTPVEVDGNLYAYDLNGDPKYPYEPDPNGGISINSVVSNIVNTINTGGAVNIDYDLIADAVWDALKTDHNATGSMGEIMNNIPTLQEIVDGLAPSLGLTADQEWILRMAYEEARRSRAMQTNKVDISRVGSGDTQLDTINVFDDDGTTLLYTITVTGEDCDNRQVTYARELPVPNDPDNASNVSNTKHIYDPLATPDDPNP